MRLAASLFVALLLLAPPVRAADPVLIDAPSARTRAAAGEITVIDVRSPPEWRRTGVAKDAVPVTIHRPDGMAGFVAATLRALDGHRERPVAVICATGRRSTMAAEALRDAGFTRVLNIREGMLGNRADGPGWLTRKLPVEDCRGC